MDSTKNAPAQPAEHVYRAEVVGVKKRAFDLEGYRVTFAAADLEEVTILTTEPPAIGAAFDITLTEVKE